jgi:hypothetical protein
VSRELIAAGVLVWLIGAVVGWYAGWVAGTEQNRAWHAGTHHQLNQAHTELAALRAELATTLDELDHTQALAWRATPPPTPIPTVVQVNLPSPLPPVIPPNPLPALPPAEGTP